LIPLAICNSSPLIALGRIGAMEILEKQFERILVPKAVEDEVGEVPPWIQVISSEPNPLIRVFPNSIHKGEAAVIMLSLQYPDALTLMDDWYARKFAVGCGLRVMGTVGLILRAKREGIIPLVRPLVVLLQENGFRISPSIVRESLLLAGEPTL
jgi:predicted nucleic acid-binding protein